LRTVALDTDTATSTIDDIATQMRSEIWATPGEPVLFETICPIKLRRDATLITLSTRFGQYTHGIYNFELKLDKDYRLKRKIHRDGVILSIQKIKMCHKLELANWKIPDGTAIIVQAKVELASKSDLADPDAKPTMIYELVIVQWPSKSSHVPYKGETRRVRVTVKDGLLYDSKGNIIMAINKNEVIHEISRSIRNESGI